MEIKGPSLGGVNLGPVKPNGVDTPPPPAESAASTVEAPANGPPEAMKQVVAGYTKADLDDNGKLDTLMRGSIRALIDGQSGVTGQLSDAGKQQITDWMMSDPAMSSRIRTFLERILD
jgi:hypothetical protein